MELEILDATEKEYFYFGGVKSLESIVGKAFLEYYTQERLKRGIWSNGIRIKSQELDCDFMKAGQKMKRRLRYIDTELMEDVVTLTISDNKIFISSSYKEHYGLAVESPGLVHLLKILWQNQWQSAAENK